MKKIWIVWVTAFLLFFSPMVSYGQLSPECNNTPSTTLCNPIRSSEDNIAMFAFRAVATVSTFFTLFAVIFVVFSGFRMIMSQGDAEALTTAKNAFVWSIFGLILAIFAYVIIYATAEYLGAEDIDVNSYIGNKRVINPLKDDTFLELLIRFLTGFLSLVGILAILMIVIGGFRYVTSAGNEEQAESGKKTLQWAIIGLLAALFSYVLVRATLTFFGN